MNKIYLVTRLGRERRERDEKKNNNKRLKSLSQSTFQVSVYQANWIENQRSRYSMEKWVSEWGEVKMKWGALTLPTDTYNNTTTHHTQCSMISYRTSLNFFIFNMSCLYISPLLTPGSRQQNYTFWGSSSSTLHEVKFSIIITLFYSFFWCLSSVHYIWSIWSEEEIERIRETFHAIERLGEGKEERKRIQNLLEKCC